MNRASDCIFEFWRNIPGSTFIHPSDQATFDREGPKSHQFYLDCLPSPFFGPLRTAPVILLFLNPGFSQTDRERAHLQEEQDYYASQRNGFGKLPEGKQPGTDWCQSHIKQLGITYEQARNNVAFVNICPYHSIAFKDSHMLVALKSSRAMIDFAQINLFPAAERGERLVVCLRSPRRWGLEKGRQYGISLFAPDTGPGGNMGHKPIRAFVQTLAQKLCR